MTVRDRKPKAHEDHMMTQKQTMILVSNHTLCISKW